MKLSSYFYAVVGYVSLGFFAGLVKVESLKKKKNML